MSRSSTSSTVRLRYKTCAAPSDDQGPTNIDGLLNAGVRARSTGVFGDDCIARLDNLTRESRVEVTQAEEVREEEWGQKGVADGKSVEVGNDANDGP